MHKLLVLFTATLFSTSLHACQVWFEGGSELELNWEAPADQKVTVRITSKATGQEIFKTEYKSGGRGQILPARPPGGLHVEVSSQGPTGQTHCATSWEGSAEQTNELPQLSPCMVSFKYVGNEQFDVEYGSSQAGTMELKLFYADNGEVFHSAVSPVPGLAHVKNIPSSGMRRLKAELKVNSERCLASTRAVSR